MSSASPDEKGTTQPRRLLVLALCCMSLLLVSLDNTALNVALPSLQRDLHASVSGLQWTLDAYSLVLASFLMLSGSTAHRVGRRRVFQTGESDRRTRRLRSSGVPGRQYGARGSPLSRAGA